MKISYLCIITFLLAICASGQSVSFIRQIESIEGVVVTTDIPLDKDKGKVKSNPIEADYTVFQLYTTYQKDATTTELLLLDEKAVGSFLPAVTIETVSEDPYVPTTTRADQPYELRIDISGLKTGDLIPDYAKSVLIGRGYKLYNEETFTPTGETGYHEDEWVYVGNGLIEKLEVFPRIPGGTPAWTVGADLHSVFLSPDTGFDYQITSEEVIVWPMAFARLEEVIPGETYYDLPETSRITLGAAYPRSTTYARLYKGPQVPDPDAVVLPGTITVFGSKSNDPNVPRNTTVPLGSIASYLSGDGQYTMEIVTITPFNGGQPEVLSAVTFTIDRTLEVKGTLNSAER